jgi:hypothetical protein
MRHDSGHRDSEIGARHGTGEPRSRKSSTSTRTWAIRRAQSTRRRSLPACPTEPTTCRRPCSTLRSRTSKLRPATCSTASYRSEAPPFRRFGISCSPSRSGSVFELTPSAAGHTSPSAQLSLGVNIHSICSRQFRVRHFADQLHWFQTSLLLWLSKKRQQILVVQTVG